MDPAHETKMDERRKNTDLEILYKKLKIGKYLKAKRLKWDGALDW